MQWDTQELTMTGTNTDAKRHMYITDRCKQSWHKHASKARTLLPNRPLPLLEVLVPVPDVRLVEVELLGVGEEVLLLSERLELGCCCTASMNCKPHMARHAFNFVIDHHF